MNYTDALTSGHFVRIAAEIGTKNSMASRRQWRHLTVHLSMAVRK